MKSAHLTAMRLNLPALLALFLIRVGTCQVQL